MDSSTSSKALVLRCALATALVSACLLVGCDRGREPSTVAPAASAASGATQ